MIPIQDKGESRQLFEWVSAKELKEIDWPLCIKLDGGGAPHYVTVCSMEELQSHVSHFNSIEEIQFARPIPQSSLKEGVCKEATMFYKDKILVKFQDPTEDQLKYLLYADTVIREKESSLTPKSIRDSSLKLSHADITKKALEIFGDENSALNIKQHEAFINGAIWVLAESAFPPPNEKSASLKPNKLTDSEIEKMAEAEVNEFWTDGGIKLGKEELKDFFIAGCKAILNKQK